MDMNPSSADSLHKVLSSCMYDANANDENFFAAQIGRNSSAHRAEDTLQERSNKSLYYSEAIKVRAKRKMSI
jgi:hypothetical protein